MRRIPTAVFLLIAAPCLTGLAGDVSGRVIGSDQEAGTIDLRTDSGEVLEAVRVSPGDLAVGYDGRPIRGTLDRNGSETRLKGIWPDDPVMTNAMSGVNRTLIREAASLGRGESLGRGDYLPDFALFNQRADPVFARDLRTRPTVITFLFTRCADPKMCPATAARLAELGRRVSDEGWDDVRLVAVSFDPEYDTPGILRQYGKAVGMDSSVFELLTGDRGAIEALLRKVGVRTINENGTIVHNLVTLLADDHGRIVLRQDGSRWSADAIFERLKEMQP